MNEKENEQLAISWQVVGAKCGVGVRDTSIEFASDAQFLHQGPGGDYISECGTLRDN